MFKSSLKTNLFANFAGSCWAAAMQLAFIPLYIKILGIESFGLIGFYLTIQMVLQVLDFGLTPTINRELARSSVLPDRGDQTRDMVRTLELCYWGVALLIGAAIVLLAPLIATAWLNSATLPARSLSGAVALMGVLAAFQWPLTFYQGGLMGLQRQPLVSVLNIVSSTLSNAGAVLVLWLVSPTIAAFFQWRILIAVIQISLNTWFLWHSLPKGSRPAHFEAGEIRRVWKFSVTMGAISLSGVILTQLDKVILSKMLTLERYGYYILAYTVVNGLSLLVSPIFNTIFPRFSALIAAGEEESLKRLYRRSTQLMAVVILPCGVLVAFFAHELIGLWTGNPVAAAQAAPIARILVVGTAINGLMYLPYTLQIASGRTRIALGMVLSLIACAVPATLFLTSRYGALGAASVWAALNILYMAFGVVFTHRRLLVGEAKVWFSNGIYPFAGIVATALLGRHLLDSCTSTATVSLLVMAATLLLSVAVAVAISQVLRGMLYSE